MTLSVKLVLLGASGVGKSSIVNRLIFKDFKEDSEVTLKAAYFKYAITVKSKSVNIDIWDTAGQERFAAITPMYYRGAHVIVAVFDVTSQDSFEKAQHQIRNLRQSKNMDQAKIALFGNKIDADNWGVKKVDVTAYCSQNNVTEHYVSAKTGASITESINKVCTDYVNEMKNDEHLDVAQGVALQRSDEKKGCC